MRAIRLATIGFVAWEMAACGGGGGGGSTPPPAPPPTPTYTVSGSVTGLVAGRSVVLQLNGSDGTAVSGNGAFTFSTAVASGANYAVTVMTQPVGLTCTITNGSGTIGSANIANVAVACATARYNVSVTIGGLPYGQSITLLDNGVDALARSVNGTANFATPVDYGQPYAVTISVPPVQQACNLTGVTTGTVSGPVDVTVDCPHFAYVTNEGDNTLSTYQVVNATGGLTVSPANPVATIAAPYFIITTPNQAFAYVTSLNSASQAANGIYVYGIDATGALTANASNPFVSGIQSYGLAFSPIGGYAIQPDYTNGNVAVFAVDTTTGALGSTALGTYAAGTHPDAVAITPDGKYVYVPSGSGGTLYGYVIAAGGTFTGGVPGSPFAVSGAGNFAGVAVDPLGKFVYIGGNTTSNIFGFAIDDATGGLAAIAGSPFSAGANPSGVTIHPNGKFLYVANYGSQNISGYTINPGSGALVPMAGSPYASGINPESLTIGPTGQFAYAVNSRLSVVPASAGTVSVFSIDQASGVLSEIAGSPFAAGTNPQTMAFR